MVVICKVRVGCTGRVAGALCGETGGGTLQGSLVMYIVPGEASWRVKLKKLYVRLSVDRRMSWSVEPDGI